MRDWAEDHWAGVGVVVFIAGALTLSVIIALGFNIIASRHGADTGQPASISLSTVGATSSMETPSRKAPARIPAPAMTSAAPSSGVSG